jgi:polyisoprenoid-binding protein YceI
MRHTKNTFLLVLVAGLLQTASAQSSQDVSQYSFTSDTQLFIDGTSSVHDWTCEVPDATGAFTTATSEADAAFAITGGTVSIRVEDIDCGKRIMNNKLEDALTANDAETIDFEVASADVSAQDGNAFTLDVTGNLTIAGSTQAVELTANGTMQNGTIQFEGSHTMLQSDFGIDPPTALLGRLKTGDEVTVRFVVTATPN